MTRHRFDAFSLLAGLALISLAVAAMTGVWYRSAASAWVWPALLLVSGAMVLGAVVAGTRGRRATDDRPVDDASSDLPPHHDPGLVEARAEVDRHDVTSPIPDADDGP